MNHDENNTQLILVDERDSPVGFETKLKAHQNGGKLHRAFSIFVFNAAGQLLLQRRALGKYHFAGLWTNTCCSHPSKGQELEDAVHERLQYEFGFDTGLKNGFSFVYRAHDDRSGLTEHEFDHVFFGEFNGQPQPNPDEIADWKWINLDDLREDLGVNSQLYTPWFKIAIDEVTQRARDFASTRLDVGAG